MASTAFSGSSVGKESACNAGDPGSIPGWGRSPREGTGYPLQYSWATLVAQLVKNPPAVWETWVRSLDWEDSLAKGKATHSSIWPEEFHGLYSPWGCKVGQDWAAFTFTFHSLCRTAGIVPTPPSFHERAIGGFVYDISEISQKYLGKWKGSQFIKDEQKSQGNSDGRDVVSRLDVKVESVKWTLRRPKHLSSQRRTRRAEDPQGVSWNVSTPAPWYEAETAGTFSLYHVSVQRLSQIPANWGVGGVRRGRILTVGSGMSSPMETQASKMLYSLPNSNFPQEPTSFLILWFPRL